MAFEFYQVNTCGNIMQTSGQSQRPDSCRILYQSQRPDSCRRFYQSQRPDLVGDYIRARDQILEEDFIRARDQIQQEIISEPETRSLQKILSEPETRSSRRLYQSKRPDPCRRLLQSKRPDFVVEYIRTRDQILVGEHTRARYQLLVGDYIRTRDHISLIEQTRSHKKCRNWEPVSTFSFSYFYKLIFQGWFFFEHPLGLLHRPENISDNDQISKEEQIIFTRKDQNPRLENVRTQFICRYQKMPEKRSFPEIRLLSENIKNTRV